MGGPGGRGLQKVRKERTERAVPKVAEPGKQENETGCTQYGKWKVVRLVLTGDGVGVERALPT